MEVRSAGTHWGHGHPVHESSVAAMRELGIDISDLFPKAVDWEFATKADRIVLCGAGVQLEVPKVLQSKTEPWSVPDPYGHQMPFFREVRDRIKVRVERLLGALAKEPAAAETREKSLAE